jgi:TonB family protein
VLNHWILLEGRNMSELWKNCEGHVVDEQFPLLQFLANTNHSAVFLTRIDHPEPRQAAIKFISADIPAPEQQLAIWSSAAQLEHPNLLRLYHSGRCRIARMELLYVVMERADEDLSQFLPQRPLTPQETREMLNPLVEGLVYLHSQGFAHSHVKPSNLLAIVDQFKLSSDTILPLGETREFHRDRDIYDAPEQFTSSNSTASAAADIWSLGVTLVEALTQQAPPLPYDDEADPAIPSTLPEPFLQIARQSLLRDPDHRESIAELSAMLNPAAASVVDPAAKAVPVAASASAAASAAGSAASAPSPVLPPAITTPPVTARAAALAPLAASPVRIAPTSAPVVLTAENLPNPLPPLPPTSFRESESRPRKANPFFSYAIPVVLAALLIVGAYFTLPKILQHPSEAAVSTAAADNSISAPSPAAPAVVPPAPQPSKSTAAAPTKSPASASSAKSLDENSVGTSSKPTSAPEHARPAEPASTPSAIPDADSSLASAASKSSSASPDHGAVLDQVLPQASAKALSTIHGIVRVVVNVQVDAAGNVSSADLESAGPSKYFADLSQRAAQHWQFASPVSEGRSLPSQWQIRFEFSPTGVAAFPTPATR